MARSWSASSIPTCSAPRLAPPERTKAVRGSNAPPVARHLDRWCSVAVGIALPGWGAALQLARQSGLGKMPRASHHARVFPRCGFLAIERRPVGLERGPAGGRARGGPCSIRGPDCVALLSPVRVRGDSGIHDRASSETPDHRAHLNGRRSASTGSTAATPNAVKVSLRASWTLRGLSPCGTATNCLKCRGSTVATVDRKHGLQAPRSHQGSPWSVASLLSAARCGSSRMVERLTFELRGHRVDSDVGRAAAERSCRRCDHVCQCPAIRPPRCAESS
jgi:hypothetical protein